MCDAMRHLILLYPRTLLMHAGLLGLNLMIYTPSRGTFGESLSALGKWRQGHLWASIFLNLMCWLAYPLTDMWPSWITFISIHLFLLHLVAKEFESRDASLVHRWRSWFYLWLVFSSFCFISVFLGGLNSTFPIWPSMLTLFVPLLLFSASNIGAVAAASPWFLTTWLLLIGFLWSWWLLAGAGNTKTFAWLSILSSPLAGFGIFRSFAFESGRQEFYEGLWNGLVRVPWPSGQYPLPDIHSDPFGKWFIPKSSSYYVASRHDIEDDIAE